MDVTIRQAVEAILFVADEPVDAATLCQVLEVSRDRMEAELTLLSDRLIEEQRGFVLRQVGGGWRLYSAPATHAYLERWTHSDHRTNLSQAALETLAVIAYKQPVTRQEVGEIRRVNVDGVIRTLLSRGLVEEVGRHDGPGQAILYGTTTAFLERLGLEAVEDLPRLADFLDEGRAPDEPAQHDLPATRQLGADHHRAGDGHPVSPDGDRPAHRARNRPAERAADPADGRVDERLTALAEELDTAVRNAVARVEAAADALEPDDEQTERHGDEPPAGTQSPGGTNRGGSGPTDGVGSDD